jgi:hypothetical protein
MRSKGGLLHRHGDTEEARKYGKGRQELGDRRQEAEDRN